MNQRHRTEPASAEGALDKEKQNNFHFLKPKSNRPVPKGRYNSLSFTQLNLL